MAVHNDMLMYVNGSVLPEASGVQVAYQDIDYNSGRTADGTMHRNRVGMKRKVNVTWPYSKQSDVQSILSKVGNKSFFTFEYYDPMTSAKYEGRFYVGDRTVTVYTYSTSVAKGFGSTNKAVYQPFTIDFIEE